MESAQIVVSGFPEGTTKSQLMIYFQSERESGGGDVDSIEIDRGRAFVTFEDLEAAKRVARRRNHRLQNSSLRVQLLLDPESSNTEDEDGPNSSLENAPMTREHRPWSKRPATFEFSSVTRKRRQREACASQQCTVKVTGVPAGTSQDLLMYYFENPRRSNGGKVIGIDMKPDLQMGMVTFELPEDAKRTAENSPHNVAGLCLHVCLLEEQEKIIADDHEEASGSQEDSGAEIIIIASGIPPSSSEDSVRYYFENSRRSGGGEICDIYFSHDGKAVITFTAVEDLRKLLQTSHFINGKAISVERLPPKEKLPPDPFRLYVRGLNEKTTEDCLLFYLEKFSDVEVKEVIRGCDGKALAIFAVEPDFKSLFDNVHGDERGLEGSKLRLEHAPVCSCVLVSGLKDETTEETIQLYFENKRTGGNVVNKVERETKNSALVYFQDPSSVHTVPQMKHTLEGNELEVQPFYHFLENTVTNKKEIPFDAHIFEYIKRNHEHELQTLKDEKKVELFMDVKKSFLIISPSDKRKISQKLWQDRTGCLENFLLSFKKIEIPLSSDLFDEVSERWQEERPRKESPTDVTNFSRHDLLVQIFGKEDRVDEDGRKLQDLIFAVEEDRDVMKSKVKVIKDGIPKSRLRLLEMTGICQKLQSEQQHLNISIDLDNETLCLSGPRNLLNEVQAEVFTFLAKMIEKTIELPPNITRVLKMPLVSSVVEDLLKQRGVQAIFVHDQCSSSNEIQVISVDPHSAKEAEKELLGAIQENSIRLTEDNAQVLDSRPWKDFQTTLTSKFKVDILVQIPSNTVWVSGIAKDVKQCYDEVIEFLQKNTILRDTVPLDHGSTRFVFERLSSEIEEIKRDLASCSIDMRISPSSKGIDISGTAEGIDKCLPRLVDLITNIQKVSVPIDRPGMTKFFSEGKGPKSLKAIEDSNNCIIITSERNVNAAPQTHEAGGRKLETSSGEFICSFLTSEGKKISVFKDDITKHRVDAIVNPANEELKHIGGLAAAIVKVGGTEIQGHCNEYIEKHGLLLEGRTFVTPAGMLPCDRVIHTVGPKWDTAAEIIRKNGTKTLKERVLETAIRNCLKEAASLRSIAIPAVSSGQFDFPRDLCAKVILDTVVDFCKANPTCNLSEIHLVNHDSPTVKVFVDEMRYRFAKETHFIHKENPTPMGFGVDVASNPRQLPQAPSSFKTPEGIHIMVKVGDLAQEQANILVGTASGNLDLDQNPCAMALSRAAGQGMQRECSTKKPVAVGDIAVLSQTGRLNCQAVIFAICCDWNNGQGRKILKDILTKCLKEAEKNNMTSIAFAAIGTGTLRFPRDQVAEIYFDEVLGYSQKNPSTKVKDVRFVLYDKDTLTVQAFNEELQKRFKSTIHTSSPGTITFSPVIERRSDHMETNVGTLCFQVQPGDITKESTEAIAVITNNSLDLSVGQGAGAAILQKGGDSIRNECSMYGPQAPGSIIVTKAGGLNAKYLFHIVPVEPLTAKSMKASVLTCLQEADKRRLTSISFPAIGTGILGMSAKSSANTMLSAVRTFSDQHPAHVQLIKMTIFQRDMIKDVRSAMYEASGQKIPTEPGMLQKFAKSVARRMGLRGTEESSTTPATQQADSRMLDLVIFAGCERDLHQAKEAVKVLMTDNSSQRIIKNEVIRNLSKEDMGKIHTLELRYSVEATVEKEVDRIELRGQPEDILSVMGDIHELLYKIKTDEQERIRAEVVSKDIQWKYKIGNTFVEYERQLNAEIELAYHQNRKAMEIHQDGERYKISFVDMTEEDENGQRTEIKRIDSRKGLQTPDYWDPQPHDKKMHIVELKPSTHAQEYKKVSDLFSGTCSNRILKLERIQNPALYGLYAIQRQKMDEANGLGSNEKLLFHGTAGGNCNAINHKGFNRSYGWQKNNLYGKGVYFAAQADYSASSQFSPPDPTGRRHMYLAKVLVGEYTVGKPNILEPPPKHPMDPTDTYDSVVDQIPNPEIFVVFQDPQCYPEYLITFQ